jgi:hypothetical protein
LNNILEKSQNNHVFDIVFSIACDTISGEQSSGEIAAKMQIMKNFEKTEFSRKILIHLFPIS